MNRAERRDVLRKYAQDYNVPEQLVFLAAKNGVIYRAIAIAEGTENKNVSFLAACNTLSKKQHNRINKIRIAKR